MFSQLSLRLSNNASNTSLIHANPFSATSFGYAMPKHAAESTDFNFKKCVRDFVKMCSFVLACDMIPTCCSHNQCECKQNSDVRGVQRRQYIHTHMLLIPTPKSWVVSSSETSAYISKSESYRDAAHHNLKLHSLSTDLSYS